MGIILQGGIARHAGQSTKRSMLGSVGYVDAPNGIVHVEVIMKINEDKAPVVGVEQPMLYAFIVYPGSAREYLFRTFESGLVADDVVLTKTKRGLVIGTFTRYGEADPIATAYVLGKIDPKALEASRA